MTIKDQGHWSSYWPGSLILRGGLTCQSIFMMTSQQLSNNDIEFQ